VDGLPIPREWYIVQRKGKRFSAMARAFREFVMAESRDLISVPSPVRGGP